MVKQYVISLFSFVLGGCIVQLTSYLVGLEPLPFPWTTTRSAKQYNNEVHISTSVYPRIFCMIFTTYSTFETKANAINLTWAQRCSGYAFFYSKLPPSDNGREMPLLPGAYQLSSPEGRDHLTAKVTEALRISYQVSMKQKVPFDWFLKADDDVYIIMENLRKMLSGYDPDRGMYFGHTSGEFLPKGYNSGGAGYVLSREATRLFSESSDKMECTLDGGFEDVEIGKCLSRFRIYPTGTRDANGLMTFHPDHPIKLLMGQAEHLAFYVYSKGNQTFGNPSANKIMSPDTISFHYMDPAHILMYDFLLYDLRRPEQFLSTQKQKDNT